MISGSEIRVEGQKIDPKIGEKLVILDQRKGALHGNAPHVLKVDGRGGLAGIRVEHEHVAHLRRIMECHACHH